jgi:hypothetical protein
MIWVATHYVSAKNWQFKFVTWRATKAAKTLFTALRAFA